MTLSKKDKSLIDELISGDPEGLFFKEYKNKIMAAALKYAKGDSVVAEDLFQDLYKKIFSELQDPETRANIQNLSAWLNEVIKNFCLNNVKKQNAKKASHNGEVDSYPAASESFEDEYVIKEISESSAIDQLKSHSMNLYWGIEFSLDYVNYIFWDLNVGEEARTEFMRPYFEVRRILSKARDEIYSSLNLPSKDEIELVFLKREIKDPKNFDELRLRQLWDKAAMSDIPLQKFAYILRHFHDFDKYYKKSGWGAWTGHGEFFLLVDEELQGNFKNLDNLFLPINAAFLPDENEFYYLIEYLPKIKCDPIYLIFLVWQKMLKRGKYTNLEFIRRLLLEFKKKEGKGKRAGIFKSVGNDFNIETLRKKVQRPSKNKAMYEELAYHIIEKCFLNLASPYRRIVDGTMISLEKRKKQNS